MAIRCLHSLAGAAALMLLTGCAARVDPPAAPAPETVVSASSSSPYQLFTHCGIHEIFLHGTYFATDHVLDDGYGNPPEGWGNPYQAGTITITGAEAVFHDDSGHEVTFHARPGATGFLGVCS